MHSAARVLRGSDTYARGIRGLIIIKNFKKNVKTTGLGTPVVTQQGAYMEIKIKKSLYAFINI